MEKAARMPESPQNPSGAWPWQNESRESYEARKRTQKRFWSSLEEVDWNITFDSLQIIEQNRVIVQRLQRWAPDMNKGGFLWGPVGTGKSTLLKCLINKWASETYQALFISSGKLLQDLRDTHKEGTKESLGQQMVKLTRPHLLVIDDFGVESPTEWAREQIFTLLETRRAKRRVTFFTTNLHPKDLAKTYGKRIADRILNEWCVVIECDGESWRKMNRKDEF